MSEINSEVFIRRNKLRRLFETEFYKINSGIKTSASKASVDWFHIKYSQHLVDRSIQREIDEQYVFSLFHKLAGNPEHVKEVAQFLLLPERPDIDEDFVVGIEYRPLRLEITDGNLWLGLTVSKPDPNKRFTNSSLQCRMAIVNSKRFAGKNSKHVITIK